VAAVDGVDVTAAFRSVPPPPTVALTEPNGGEDWGRGSVQRIAWTHNLGEGSAVRLEISRDTGATWTTLAAAVPNATASTGFYDWTVGGSSSKKMRVRVVAATNTSVADTSDASFRIGDPFVHVTAPDAGGATWKIGSTRAVRWEHNLGTSATVRIRISRDGGSTYTTIADAVANAAAGAGSYGWTVTGPKTTRARIRVEWKARADVRDSGDRSFAIKP